MRRLTQLVAAVLLGIGAAAMSNSQGQTQSAATSPPAMGMPPAQTQVTPSQPLAPGQTLPFQISFSVSISNGATSGSGTFTAPSSGELVIQTISMYRSGGPAGTFVQCYLGVNSAATFGYYAIPIVGDGSTGPFPGTTLAATVYADPSSTAAVNCYRSGTVGTETEFMNIAGYQTGG